MSLQRISHTGIKHTDSTNFILASYNYTLDDAGYREQVVEKDGNRIEWEYDNLYRLTSEKRYGIDGSTLLQTTGFTYDLANNRQTMTVDGQLTTYHYNNLDQMTSIDHPGGVTSTYDYDGRGNLAEVFDGTTSTFYGYDALDRLEEVILPTGSVYYDYDADGRRVKQTVGANVTNYLWDEFSAYGDVVMESDGSSTILASYTLAEGQLIAQTRGGNKSYYLKDGQNSTRLLTNTLGVETDRYTYTAFGEHTQMGSTINNYLYTGQQFDPLTELYSLRARYYNPIDGRFLSRDTYDYNYQYPIELNRYVYATDNPVNFSDPSGLTILVQQGQINLSIGVTLKSIAAVLGGALACYDSNYISYLAAAAKSKALLIAFEVSSPSPTPCHIPILLYPSLLTPQIGQHIKDAQAMGHPMLLTYDRANKGNHDKKRRLACKGFTGRPLSCDEYPFASTTIGGVGSSIRPVPGWEQSLQGTELSVFYATKLKYTDDFAVVVVP